MTDAAAVLGLDGHPWAATPAAPEVAEELRAAVLADRAPTRLSVAAPAAVPALVTLVPAALARHARLGVAPDVARDTLLDVGRKLRAYGASTDVGWLVGLMRADVVALGRLQFERVSAREGRAVHVPELGPLDPRLVDDALARAADVLGDAPLTCTSWLLDPTLPAGLPPGSNIVRFARRFATEPAAAGSGAAAGGFRASGGPTAGDLAVAKFVFRRPLADVLDPAVVVPRTRLEHLVTAHLRAGGHWTEPRGVLVGTGRASA